MSQKSLKQRPCHGLRCKTLTKMERKEIFDNFYNSGMNFDEQNIVITQNVEILGKKTTKPSHNCPNTREDKYKYGWCDINLLIFQKKRGGDIR